VLELPAQLADACRRHLEALAEIQGPFVLGHLAYDLPFPRSERLQPVRKVDTELDLIGG
jgi:hypothetical protein